MNMLELLQQRQKPIKERWIELIIHTYPANSHDFFRQQKNRFLNPVGAALTKHVDALYDGLLRDSDKQCLPPDVEEFLKVRAVQDFEPSQAVGFIFYLKQAIREELADDISNHQPFSELQIVEARIDQLLLAAFDFYMKSREKIYEIKANEFRRHSYLASRQAQADLPAFNSGSPTEVTG